MHEQLHYGLPLFGQSGSRKYLNASERRPSVSAVAAAFPLTLPPLRVAQSCPDVRAAGKYRRRVEIGAYHTVKCRISADASEWRKRAKQPDRRSRCP